MAYQSNLMGEFWRGQRQRRLATGTSLTQNEMGGLLRPTLDTEAAMAEAAARREQQQSQFNQQMDLRKNEVANQRLTGMVGGVTQAAMLPLAYGAGKSMGWWGTPQGAQTGNTFADNLLRSVLPRGPQQTTTTVSGPPMNLMSPPTTPTAPPPVGGWQNMQGDPIAPNAGSAGLSPTGPGLVSGPTAQGQIGAAGMQYPAQGINGVQGVAPGMQALEGGSLDAACLSPIAAGGQAAGLYAAQMTAGRAMQPTMNKIGMPMTGKGITYLGLPGAFAGGAYDAINKISSLF